MYSVDVRRTKIIATIGPASRDPRVIEALLGSGVNVFRLNFSHGTREDHGAILETIRKVADGLQRQAAVLQDLSGPKIRTGRLEDAKALMLSPGDPLQIEVGTRVGRPGVVSTTYAPLVRAVKPGDTLLLDDGKIALEVKNVAPDSITTRVVDGGMLGEHKGINAPDVVLPAVGVTEKDEVDLRFGLAAGVDLVALSFVQSADDIRKARAICADAGRPQVPIVAKLERPQAIARLDEIAAVADALMVARGDLGLEIPLEQVPQAQKQVLRVGRERGVPVIIATQVLESMRTESRPTRAEVADAAGAVDAGADAIMLSGETAVGDHPVRAVQVLDSIIRNAESVPPLWSLPPPATEPGDHAPALCDAAVTLAARSHADAIVAITHQGRTARLLSARRPSAQILAITNNAPLARALNLWWGVLPVLDSLAGDARTAVSRVIDQLRKRSGLPSPAIVVAVDAGPDLEQPGRNFVRVSRV